MNMNKIKFSALATAVLLTFNVGAMAQTVSKSDYVARKDSIKAQYKAAKEKCDALSGNAEDICKVEAKGQKNVATAELEASYEPNNKTRYEALKAKAEADYDLAKEKCDDLSGNSKDVCVKEAKAAYVNAESNAKLHKDNAGHGKASTDSQHDNVKVREKGDEVKKDVTENKANAAYAVEKEKCEAFSGSAKESCINTAKRQFGM